MAVVGKIIDVRSTKFDVMAYDLELDGGEIVSFLGTTILDMLIANELGSHVQITYLGESKLEQGRRLKQFKVAIWEDDAQTNSGEVSVSPDLPF